MDYSSVVQGTPTLEDYADLFNSPLLATSFAKALAGVSKSISEPRGPHKAWQGIFRSGLAHFSSAIGYRDHEADVENAVDYKGSVPEEDITQQTGITTELPTDDGEDITSQGIEIVREEIGEAAEAKDIADDPLEDLGGATGLTEETVVEGTKDDSKGLLKASDESVNIPKDSISNETNLDIGVEANLKENISQEPEGLEVQGSTTSRADNAKSVSLDLHKSDIEETNEKVTRISHILRIWFAELWAASRKYNKDMVVAIFGLPGTSSELTEKHLYDLLIRIKWYIDTVLEDANCEYSTSLKELILLLHEILHGLSFSNLRSVAHIYQWIWHQRIQAQKDDSEPITVLDETELPEISNVHSPKKQQKPTDFRLSYGTLMHIYVMYDSLANSPLNMLLVDKVSLSLDITTLEEVSANVYTNLLVHKDFEDEQVVSQFEGRVIPLLSALFNYYYGLFPDVLNADLSVSSFFSWITGYSFSPGLYVGIKTVETITNFPKNSKLNIQDPFLYEVQQYEVTNRLGSGEAYETEWSLRSPTYLTISLKLYQLIKNPSFTKYLAKVDSEKEIPLLDIWLCVSSYVHHYQFKSALNQYGARISLLTLLKLTSTKSPCVKLLREYKINEFKWKLCHQRPPVIPISNGDGIKSSLLYIIDLVQVTLRFNLSKRLDMDNCKLALTVLYQILLEGAESMFEDLQTYKWLDLYKTLVHFLKFVEKNCNEEDVKYVIEEVFCIFDLILGPAYDRIIERSSDFWLLGSHVAKSVNFELFYQMLQHYLSLHGLFVKYITKKHNFAKVASTFESLTEEFDLLSTKELNIDEVTVKLNKLSLLNEDEFAPTVLQMNKFNYAETFKYLDKYHDYIDFEKQVEIVDIFNLLYDNKWVEQKKERKH
ncbi:CIC11C00000004535 [Sungouiella intermedia]|uniref:CIC11C00000004535 n=1 Tax=Sungouiella intermedia TaxID=45354 RepID=A0A1L0DHG2_9ASCO|nr:CIC11C00000004535 [[Candida] intermedia]